MLRDMHRAFANGHKDDWDVRLPCGDFGINNSASAQAKLALGQWEDGPTLDNLLFSITGFQMGLRQNSWPLYEASAAS